jgi:hypothetical protein
MFKRIQNNLKILIIHSSYKYIKELKELIKNKEMVTVNDVVYIFVKIDYFN